MTDAQRVELHAGRWGLYTALADIRARRRHDPAGALDLLEHGRAINITERLESGSSVRPLSSTELRSRLWSGTATIVFATLPSRTLVWVMDVTGLQFFVVDQKEDSLAADVRALREAIEHRENARARESSARLFESLLGPARARLLAATRLILVPDGPLHEVPFGALWDREARAFLVERSSVLVAPSAGFAIVGRRGVPLLERRNGLALVVGNPNRGSDAENLPSLKGAEEEAVAIGDLYPNRVVLRGAQATAARFVEEMRRAAVVHFAGHALVNHVRPELSSLLMAPGASGHPGTFFAGDLDGVRLSHTQLVVLAACETAQGAVAKGEGVLGLVRSFLGAGVPSVVATLWRIDDRASAPLFEAMHAAWLRGLDAPDAVREAQLKMLRDGRSPAAIADWAAPVVAGRSVQ
jgi:CHAT domain-containing protein